MGIVAFKAKHTHTDKFRIYRNLLKDQWEDFVASSDVVADDKGQNTVTMKHTENERDPI